MHCIYSMQNLRRLGDSLVEVDLLGRPNNATLYRLYSKSHLGFGMEEAIRRYKESLQKHFDENAYVPFRILVSSSIDSCSI